MIGPAHICYVQVEGKLGLVVKEARDVNGNPIAVVKCLSDEQV